MKNDAKCLSYPRLTYFSFRGKFHNLMKKITEHKFEHGDYNLLIINQQC